MPYEITWAILILISAVALSTTFFLTRHLRKKQQFEQKYSLRQLLHKERMAALEKNVPLIEVPSLEDEIFALTEEAVPEQIRRQKLWRGAGILLVASALGVSTAFYWSTEVNLQEIWTLGLIPLAIGGGCLILGFSD